MRRSPLHLYTMKNLKKLLKIAGLVLLIVLACFGIGIAGGIPVSSANRKEDKAQIKIELLDTKDETTTNEAFEIKP